MVEVGDKVRNPLFPEEYSIGTVISRESETAFIVEYRNNMIGELYKRTTLDYDIYKNDIKKEEGK